MGREGGIVGERLMVETKTTPHAQRERERERGMSTDEDSRVASEVLTSDGIGEDVEGHWDRVCGLKTVPCVRCVA